MFFNNNFILASASVSRYKILKNNKLSFIKIVPTCKEDLLKKKLIKQKKTAKQISLELSRLKAKNISQKHKNKLVVGSDTVIKFKGVFLTKAKTLLDAKKIITQLSGKQHQIYSSASVFYNNKEVWNATQKSTIKIRDLKKSEIERYLHGAGKNILTSVGCYQAEAQGPNIIENIRGDFFNILGFPLFPFLSFLRKQKNRT